MIEIFLYQPIMIIIGFSTVYNRSKLSDQYIIDGNFLRNRSCLYPKLTLSSWYYRLKFVSIEHWCYYEKISTISLTNYDFPIQWEGIRLSWSSSSFWIWVKKWASIEVTMSTLGTRVCPSVYRRKKRTSTQKVRIYFRDLWTFDFSMMLRNKV